MEYQEWHIGPVFTVLIGFWALGSLTLGIVEFSFPDKNVSRPLTIILCIMNLFSIGGLWLQATTFGGLSISGWIFLTSFLLVPTILSDIFGVFYLVKRRELIEYLKNMKIRISLLVLILSVPIFFAISLFLTLP